MYYIVSRNSRNKYRLVEVEIVGMKCMDTVAICKRLDNGVILDRDYPRQVFTKAQWEDGLRVCKERNIIHRLKLNNKKKYGKFKCEWCNFESNNKDDITVDHVNPLKNYRNKTNGTISKKDWLEAWNDDNLIVCCKKCNQDKAYFSLAKIRKLKSIAKKKAYYINKKNVKGNRYGKFKHYGIDVNKPNALELARMSDTPYLDVDKILNPKKRKKTKDKIGNEIIELENNQKAR